MGGAFQDRQHQAICMLEHYSSIIRIRLVLHDWQCHFLALKACNSLISRC